MCIGGGKGPLDWLIKKVGKGKGKEEIREQCNDKFKGDCGKVCECIYATELASCGATTICVIKSKPIAEACQLSCPLSTDGTFRKKDAVAEGVEEP
jgi:hypothetical protein